MHQEKDKQSCMYMKKGRREEEIYRSINQTASNTTRKASRSTMSIFFFSKFSDHVINLYSHSLFSFFYPNPASYLGTAIADTVLVVELDSYSAHWRR